MSCHLGDGDADLENQIRDGLEQLAKIWEALGAPPVAEWWRRVRRHLEASTYSDLELSLQVAYGLRDLAAEYHDEGRIEQVLEWHQAAMLVERRAWQLERKRLGVG
jgi:hypothetical protein